MPVENTTFHAGEHLRKKHNVHKPGSEPRPRRSLGQVPGAAYQGLISTVQADRFRYLLIRWIVCMHVALSVVEDSTFRDLVLYICPALDPLLVKAGNTIRRWIMTEFKRQKQVICNELAQAKSQISISFDLWTSPNSLAFCAVVAHFIDKDLHNRSTLIGLPRVRGCHSGENIAEAVISVLSMLDVSKLGYFCTDNANTNDLAIKIILQRLRPDIRHPQKRRVRCLGHIINLAAMAFLFGNDPASLEAEASNIGESTYLEAQLHFWRRKGSKGKLHNLVYFIRKTPQRRERFAECCKVANTTDDEVAGMSKFSNFFAKLLTRRCL
jgi:hypothetical protein